MIDALGFALLAQNEGLWAIPGYIMRSELCAAFLLKYLCYPFEALDKINLAVAAMMLIYCPLVLCGWLLEATWVCIPYAYSV